MVAHLTCRDRIGLFWRVVAATGLGHAPSMVWRMCSASPLPGGMQGLAKRWRRSPILWGPGLDSVAPRHEEVVQGLLLRPCLFQFIRISLIALHADQGLVVAVGSLV